MFDYFPDYEADYKRLLLVVRVIALEDLLVAKGIITPDELDESIDKVKKVDTISQQLQMLESRIEEMNKAREAINSSMNGQAPVDALTKVFTEGESKNEN